METITLKDLWSIVKECGVKCALTFLYHRIFWHETFIEHIMSGETHTCYKSRQAPVNIALLKGENHVCKKK